MKFEIGRELIENFGKFEKPSSKFHKIGKLDVSIVCFQKEMKKIGF